MIATATPQLFADLPHDDIQRDGLDLAGLDLVDPARELRLELFLGHPHESRRRAELANPLPLRPLSCRELALLPRHPRHHSPPPDTLHRDRRRFAFALGAG